jgi:hypothetical protein
MNTFERSAPRSDTRPLASGFLWRATAPSRRAGRAKRATRARALGVLAVNLVVASIALAGCSVPANPQCKTWEIYDTPQDAEKDADAVVIGTVVNQSGTQDWNGTEINVWQIEVESWIKGSGPTQIEVASPPDTCGPVPTPYSSSDPLLQAGDEGRVAVFLNETGDGWETVSPFQGTIAVPDDDTLPSEWPAHDRPDSDGTLGDHDN